MWWDGIHGFYGSVVVIVIGSSRVIRRARVRKSAYHWAPSARVVSRHCSGGGKGLLRFGHGTSLGDTLMLLIRTDILSFSVAGESGATRRQPA